MAIGIMKRLDVSYLFSFFYRIIWQPRYDSRLLAWDPGPITLQVHKNLYIRVARSPV